MIYDIIIRYNRLKKTKKPKKTFMFFLRIKTSYITLEVMYSNLCV
jgi:hypothetical protein